MSIRLIAGDVPEEGLPPSALQSKGLGRWGDSKLNSTEGVQLEIRVHALFRVADSVATLDGVTVAISGFVYSPTGQRRQDALLNLAKSYRRGLDHFHTALSHLEGEFSGVLIDAEHRKLHAFSNKCGTVPLFISKHGDNVVVSCHLLEHAVLMHHLGIPIDMNSKAAMAYLGHGGMVDHATLIRGVERVLPGEVIAIDRSSGEIQKNRYFLFSNDTTGPVGDEAAEALDSAFTNAVKRQYQLDLGFGKRHIGSLSGGLDSRMDAVVAFDCGYENRVNYTFGDLGCKDLRIAEEIARFYQQSQITIGLGGGSFVISSLRDAAILNGGISLAAGTCHGVFAASHVDWSEYGLLHTGQLGDAVLGSYLTAPRHAAPNAEAGGYSNLFAAEVLEDKAAAAAGFENHELFMLYTRGFLTVNSGLAMLLPVVPTISPFLDTEFLQVCLSISSEERWKQKAYFHWIRKMRPAAGKFTWEKTGSMPGTIQIRGRTPRVWMRRFSRRMRGCFRRSANRRLMMTGMNPFDKWEQENPALGRFISVELNRVGHLGMEVLGEEKWSKVMVAIKEGTCMQRLQVLSFLFTVDELKGVSATISP